MECALLYARHANRFRLETIIRSLSRHLSASHFVHSQPTFNQSLRIPNRILTQIGNNRVLFGQFRRLESTQNPEKPPTLTQKLKKAVAEYGSTVIVFHVCISLVSLGTFYLLVSSGLDVNKLIVPLGISDETASKLAANAGTFAIAYGVHKVFAPARIMITLTATPFIVRYLRRIGFIKVKK